MTFDPNSIQAPNAKIKVIGVGGGGTNAVSTMVREKIEGVEFIAANTDIQSLKSSLAPTKIQIGKELTKGLGAGADPSIGRDAALEDRFEIQEAIGDADMVFITAGMGGGTGTGSAAIASQIAKETGALTVGVVTTPFDFEGKRRRRHAEAGIANLKEHVDTLITVPNQKLLQVASHELTMVNAFQIADNVLVNAVIGISDIINTPGTINVDFADVKTIMSNMGQALMGVGASSGESRAIEAAQQAISSPLLDDVDIEGATGILINITAGEKVSLLEVNEACMLIQEAAHEDANVIFGVVLDEALEDQIKVTVIATGFPQDAASMLTRTEKQQQRMLSDISNYNQRGGLYVPSHYKRKAPSTPKAPAQPRQEFSHTTTQAPKTQSEKPEQNLTPPPAPAQSFTPPAPIPEHRRAEPPKPEQHSRMEEARPQEPRAEPSRPTEPSKASSPPQEAREPQANHHQASPTEDALEQNHNLNEKREENQNIEQKIDDALELAQRVKEIPSQEDSLDIPTFLRQSTDESNKNNPSD